MHHFSAKTFVALAALVTAVTACQDTADPVGPETVLTEAPRASGLAPFTLGYLQRAHPQSPCMAPAYQEFDFWLGEWNVESLGGAPIGTNLVRTRADGCIVEENWVASSGNAGRSINTYDAETGLWTQTWVSANAAGHLRMFGGLDDDGHMILEGKRVQPNGIEFFDRYEWTPLADGRVRQDGSVVVPGFFEGSFTGIYVPADDFEPFPVVGNGSCQPGGFGGVSRMFDYAAGSWSVEANGREIASSEVIVDLDGCLFEEIFTTTKGYEAVAFTYYMWREDRWYRTYIDSEGERLELEGQFEGDVLVLTGTEVGRGASGTELIARITWTPRADGSLEVAHSTSSDGGTTWHEELVLDYVPS